MPVPFSGGCACGAIRYSCSAEPFVSYACHCTECQKRTSAAFGVSLQVPTEGITIEQGTPKTFDRTGDSGNTVTMKFCGECGTSIFGGSAARPHITVVYGGTLDDPSWIPIQAHIWADSAMPWVDVDTAERFPKAPDFAKYYAAKG